MRVRRRPGRDGDISLLGCLLGCLLQVHVLIKYSKTMDFIHSAVPVVPHGEGTLKRGLTGGTAINTFSLLLLFS